MHLDDNSVTPLRLGANTYPATETTHCQTDVPTSPANIDAQNIANKLRHLPLHSIRDIQEISFCMKCSRRLPEGSAMPPPQRSVIVYADRCLLPQFKPSRWQSHVPLTRPSVVFRCGESLFESSRSQGRVMIQVIENSMVAKVANALEYNQSVDVRTCWVATNSNRDSICRCWKSTIQQDCRATKMPCHGVKSFSAISLIKALSTWER
jgi:hypothetical protein